MRVTITGAAGLIGGLLADELDGRHTLTLLDRRPVAGRPSRTADLARTSPLPWRRWHRALEGADVVVHLAAATRPRAPWRRVLRTNVQSTWNVLQAAARHGVPRVVFASSHWAVRAEVEARAPACYLPDGPKVGADAPPRPTTPYGFSKAMGELAGRMLVDEGKLRDHLSVRIGWCPKTGRSQTPDAELRHRWIGHADIRGLLRRCVEAEVRGAHVVYGVSAQPESPFDLDSTRRLLDWSPVEAALAPVVEPA